MCKPFDVTAYWLTENPFAAVLSVANFADLAPECYLATACGTRLFVSAVTLYCVIFVPFYIDRFKLKLL